MKKLVLLVVALGALIWLASNEKKKQEAKLSENASSGVKTREYLFPDVDLNAAKTITIRDDSGEVNLVVEGERWTVAERGSYPAALERLRRAVREVFETKIAGKQVVGEGAWGDVGVNLPTVGESSEETGILIEMKDDSGGAIATLVLGNTVDVSGGSNPQFGAPGQRFVRIPEDENAIWMMGTSFYDMEAKPESWVDKGFVDVQQIQAVEVKGENGWKASRDSAEEDEFKLVGGAKGEVLDNGKVTLATLLSNPAFTDVEAASEGSEVMKGAAQAVLKTFDGFTYDIAVAKTTEDGADKYFMTVEVDARIEEERKAGDGEDEEEKKRLDDEFAAAKKELEEKLAKEKAFSGWIFHVAEYTVNQLLKTKQEVLLDEESEAAKPSSGPTQIPGVGLPGAAAPMAPGAPTTVTTPPVAVPPLPKTEIKPAPDPDANPAEVEGQ